MLFCVYWTSWILLQYHTARSSSTKFCVHSPSDRIKITSVFLIPQISLDKYFLTCFIGHFDKTLWRAYTQRWACWIWGTLLSQDGCNTLWFHQIVQEDFHILTFLTAAGLYILPNKKVWSDIVSLFQFVSISLSMTSGLFFVCL